MEADDALPVMAILPQLLASLRNIPNAVLIAPPGAGKTTYVAPYMLAESYCQGQILLLSPRRLAARMAAERIAGNLGEAVGASVGYATRLDSRYGHDTRILVMTEGIFRNRIINDPELLGVSAVLLTKSMNAASIAILVLRWRWRHKLPFVLTCVWLQCLRRSTEVVSRS